MTALLRWRAVGLLVSLVVLAGAAAERSTSGKAPSAAERLQTILERAEANDAAAIPQLIDLLGELPADECKTIEEYLTQLAGPWLPSLPASDNSTSAGKSRRDAWMKWWRSGDGKAQLAAMQQHVPTPERRRRVKMLIGQLSDDDFTVREKAYKELLRLGRITLPQLRQAKTSSDPETARRARDLVERLESDAATHLPRAAVRLLALHKPDGAAAALLAYLPLAEEDHLNEEVKNALIALARREGKLDAALLRALDDESPLVRTVAAEALVRGGERRGRAAVAKRLQKDTPSVRLRIALALVQSGDKDGVPVLIELLAVLPEGQLGEAEEVLYQLAGDAPPKLPDDKTKRRDAWADWWKANSQRVRCDRVNAQTLLGYTLICDHDRLLEVDRQGKILWSIDDPGTPVDAVMLANQHVLIAEWNTKRVTERDRKGTVLWQKAGLPTEPTNVQRLPNGNTFIALYYNAILEVDRAGKEVYQIKDVPNLLGAYRSRQGVIVCVTADNQCLFLDTTGKKLRSFAVKHPLNVGGCLDVLPNGRVLIASFKGRIMEYDRKGTLLHDWESPQVATPSGLPNGHVLASSEIRNRVDELTPAGKVVWEYKGKDHFIRARRR